MSCVPPDIYARRFYNFMTDNIKSNIDLDSNAN